MDFYNNDTETKVLRAYLEAAIWSSIDDTEEPMDANFCIEDIHEESIMMAMDDIEGFLELINFDKLDLDVTDVGQDFLLTRNGHGTGFWDRGYDEELETILMDATKSFGEVWLYLGDDKRLHFS